MIFQCIHETQSLLSYQIPTLFSKEHVISGSRPDNLVCGWDTLTHQKVTQVTQIVWVIQPTFNPELHVKMLATYVYSHKINSIVLKSFCVNIKVSYCLCKLTLL